MKDGENITFPTAIFSAGNLKFYSTFHAEDRATFRMRIYVVDMWWICHLSYTLSVQICDLLPEDMWWICDLSHIFSAEMGLFASRKCVVHMIIRAA